jgi:uncharacterized protein (DUF1330 family)
MTAYMIAEMDVTGPDAYEAYKAAAADVIARHGGRYIVRGGETLVLEGAPPKRVVVVECESVEAVSRMGSRRRRAPPRKHGGVVVSFVDSNYFCCDRPRILSLRPGLAKGNRR